MEPRIKVVNRTIAKSRNCRVRYNNPSDFDILVVEINYNNEQYRYAVESKHLSSDKDSIHFYPNISSNGALFIKWDGGIESYMQKIE